MYALLAVIGALLSGFVFCRLIKKKGFDDNQAIYFFLIVIAGVFIGGHLLFGLTNARYFPALFEKVEFSEWMGRAGVIFGGSVFYGGLIGGLIAGYIAIKIMHLNFTVYADCMAPVIPLFHSIARVGCFFAGCCYGIESEFGFTAHNNPYVPELNDVSRFPVQLLESVCNLILTIVLFWLLKKSAEKTVLKGKLILIYLISYACVRFFDEMLRGDAIRGFVGALSTSQFISMIIFAVSIVILIISSRKKSDS